MMPTATAPQSTTSVEGRDLILTRDFDASPDKLFRAWTEPALITQWFTPAPWTTPYAESDLRPGGESTVKMLGPNGEEFTHRGVYLEIVPNQRLVFTNAYTAGWVPSEVSPRMTFVLTFDDLGGGRTRYTAKVRHWSIEDREAHEKMGFHQGWPIATEQLAALVARL
jgi:uncharacterized protein YndB with AHSA1/START domain